MKRKNTMGEFVRFLDNYFNLKKMVEEKRAYRRMMARVARLPEDYQYVFKKIQSHMWMFTAGAGYDMMHVHEDLIELFEEGAANGKGVLEITGEDVAGFCEELLRGCETYTEGWRQNLNRDIARKLKEA